jgi:putative DNA primase/helicase
MLKLNIQNKLDDFMGLTDQEIKQIRSTKQNVTTDSEHIDWDGDIHSLDLSNRILNLIEGGKLKGLRSEAMWDVIHGLIDTHLSNEDIIFIFESNESGIGEKYYEVGANREAWLQKQIHKAREEIVKELEQDFTSPEHKSTRQVFTQKIDAADKDFDAQILIAKEISESGLPQTHQEILFKQIKERSGITLKSIRADIKNMRNGGDDESEHFATAQRTIKQFVRENILYALDTFWIWDDSGVWRKLGDRKIKQVIHEVAVQSQITQSFVNSVLDIVKTEVLRSDVQFNAQNQGINCQNGVLCFKNGKWELEPHRKEDYSITQISVIYYRKGVAPLFRRFLEDAFDQDEEKDAKVLLVYEMIGYCLLSSTEYERFFILIGAGANGKSVLMRILAEIAGPGNISAVSPDRFGDKAQCAYLMGKLINLVTELAKGSQMVDDKLKAITSGELITADHKYGHPFNFIPFCTCVFATNHMPYTRDFSDALMRRAIILNFNRVFKPEEQDKHLFKKLKEELPGILNLALEGLARLFKQGDFTLVAEVEEAKKEWQHENDQMSQFVEEACQIRPDHRITSASLYEAYVNWAINTGIRNKLKQRTVTIRLRKWGVTAEKGGKGIRVLKGIALSSIYTGIWEQDDLDLLS